MATCPSCGADVTGKKFCPECGHAVQSASPTISSHACPRCNGEVTPGASFCMHCGATLNAQPVAQTHQAAMPAFCTNCGKQAAADARFCQGCGSPLGAGAPVAQPYQPAMQQGQYPQYQQPQPQYQQPQAQYGQPQYQQQPPQYAQAGYQQPPMVLHCPTCQAMSPVGTPACPSCRTSLAYVVPTPATGQQGGIGGFLQGNNGKMVMGALGGAAAVLGGEMLLGGVEHSIERHVEGDMGGGYGYEEHRHHHRREEDGLGGLGEIANDLGLF